MKKFLTLFLSMCMTMCVGIGATACSGEGVQGPQGEQGIQGEQGLPGKDGADGKSAYELAVANGYTGTEVEWLASLAGETGASGADGKSAYDLAVEKGYQGTLEEWLTSLVGVKGADGANGADGKDGVNGTNGKDGKDGIDGSNGKSAYELAVENGFEGSLSAWLDSLVGEDGEDGVDGINGTNGKSAYELAVENGFKGSITEWLASLVGEKGADGVNGENGKTAYQHAVDNGYKGTMQEWLASLVGKDGVNGTNGKSAYEIAVANGYKGSETEWLKSLVGKDGKDGNGIVSVEKTAENDNVDTYTITFDDGSTTTFDVTNGKDGVQGIQGIQGEKGETGVGIESVVIDYMGRVVITLTDGSVCEMEVEDGTCEHTSIEEVLVYPTCLDEGYTKYICEDCGYTRINDYTPASGHHFSDRYCVFCDEEEAFGEIEPDISWYYSSIKTVELSNREQLAGLAYLVNINKVTFSGVTIKLANHIDLAGIEWVPIGNATTAFAGTFDGQGLTISNLKISNQTSYVGLFGNVSGTIKRFTLTGANVAVEGYENYVAIACGYATGTLSEISVGGYVDAPNNSNVGGVVGYYTKGLSACTSSATIIGGTYVGGIVGNIVTTESVTYDGLVNTGDVTGVDYVAGLMGRFYLNIDKSGNPIVTVNECKSSGNITGSNYVAGIYGHLYGNNSYVNSKIVTVTATLLECTGKITGTAYVGGIMGYGETDGASNISNSTVSADVSGEYNIGGFAGVLSSISISNCSNAGSTITATGYETVSGVFYARVGGYVGSGYQVSGCTNDVDITYTELGMQVGGIAGCLTSSATDCVNNGTIIGKSQVGGIAGNIGGAANATYDSLVNTGDVTGVDYVAGIAGSFNVNIEKSSNIVFTVNKCKNSGNITGVNYIAGIYGYLYGNNSYTAAKIVKVTATLLENSGVIKGSSTYVGGLMGYFYADGASTLTGYTMTGKVICNEVETNDVIIASKTNLTIATV